MFCTVSQSIENPAENEITKNDEKKDFI